MANKKDYAKQIIEHHQNHKRAVRNKAQGGQRMHEHQREALRMEVSNKLEMILQKLDVLERKIDDNCKNK